MSFLNQLTGLDILMLAVMAICVAVHVLKGFVRSILGIAGVIVGLVAAALLYHRLSPFYSDLARTETIADLASFLTVFTAVIVAKEAIIFLIYKLIRSAKLTWLDRTLGGLFGLIKGSLINAVLILALTAFPVKVELVHRSVLAPYMLLGAKAVVTLVPHELKDRFNREYQRIRKIWRENEIKHVELEQTRYQT